MNAEIRDAASYLLNELIYTDITKDEQIALLQSVWRVMKEDYEETLKHGLNIDYPSMFVSALETIAEWD